MYQSYPITPYPKHINSDSIGDIIIYNGTNQDILKTSTGTNSNILAVNSSSLLGVGYTDMLPYPSRAKEVFEPATTLLNSDEHYLYFDTGEKRLKSLNKNGTTQTYSIIENEGVAYFDGYTNVNSTLTIASFIDIPINVERIKDDIYTHATNSPEITINKNGNYIVSFRCTTNVYTGLTRSGSVMKGMIDYGGTGTYTDIVGTMSYAYNRNDKAGYGTISTLAIVDIMDGDKIKMQAKIYEGDDVETVGDSSCGITIISAGLEGPPGPPGDIVWQGQWDSGIAYDVNDTVENDGSSYTCVLSNTNQEPPNATYWDLLASKGDQGNTGPSGDISWQGEWNSTTTYIINDTVQYDGSSYVSNTNSLNNPPPNASYWDLVAERGADGIQGDIIWQGQWDSGTTFETNDTIEHNGSSYTCTTNNTNKPPPDNSYWDMVAGGFNEIQSYNSTTTYVTRDTVLYNNSSYFCKDETTGNSPPNDTYWTPVAIGNYWAGEWNSTTVYNINYLTKDTSTLYLSNTNNNLNQSLTNTTYWSPIFQQTYGSEVWYSSDLTTTTTSSDTWIQRARVTTGTVDGTGTYKIEVSFTWTIDTRLDRGLARCQIDDTTTILDVGQRLYNITNVISESAVYVTTLSSGTHTVDVDFAVEDTGDTMTIDKCSIVVTRIS